MSVNTFFRMMIGCAGFWQWFWRQSPGPWLVGQLYSLRKGVSAQTSHKITVQNIPEQSEFACICTFTAFHHMAKQHSREGSAKDTDKTTVESQYSIRVHTAVPDTRPFYYILLHWMYLYGFVRIRILSGSAKTQARLIFSTINQNTHLAGW